MKVKSGLIFIIIVGVIFIIIGIVAMYLGTGLTKRCTEETIGTVVEMAYKEDYVDGYSIIYYPVIEYQAGDTTVKQMSNTGQYPPKYKVGDQITIYYNSDNVQEFLIKGDASANLGGILAVVLGTIAVVIGLFGSIKTARRT